MNINALDKFLSRFTTSLHVNQLKLSDLTAKKTVQLTDAEMLKTDEATPNKFETETIRFWRIKKLLPFFEEKKHARISLAQLMWLRFLSELRKVSPSTIVMEKAHDYLIKRAYDKRLGYNTILGRENEFKKIENPSVEIKQILAAYDMIIKDKGLMYSLDRDINYFNMAIVDYIVNDTNVIFVYYYKKIIDIENGEIREEPVFDIIKDGQIEFERYGNKYNSEFNYDDKPCVLIPAKYIVYDTFYDCNLSDNAFNIQILEKSEKEVFKYIREKLINEVYFFNDYETISPNNYELLDAQNEHITNSIKEIKYKMATKKYRSGSAKLKNGEMLHFNPDPSSIENRK